MIYDIRDVKADDSLFIWDFIFKFLKDMVDEWIYLASLIGFANPGKFVDAQIIYPYQSHIHSPLNPRI